MINNITKKITMVNAVEQSILPESHDIIQPKAPDSYVPSKMPLEMLPPNDMGHALRGQSAIAVRLSALVKDPAAAALKQLVHFVSAHAPNQKEAKVLENRVEKLLQSSEQNNLTAAQRFVAAQQAFFFGRNFPSLEGVSYKTARMYWGAGLVGALGALTNPMTAILLPVVMKGAFDVGRVLTVLPHYFGDELADLVIGKNYAGKTMTSFPTVDDFQKEYNRVVRSKMNGTSKVDDPRTFGFHAIGHHILEGQQTDIANSGADIGRDLIESMGRPLLPLALCALHPALGLLAAAATGGLAGLQLFYESHRETHRPLGQKSLMGLAFEALGWTSTRDEHAVHHRPDHMTSFTTSSPAVDGWFDACGLPSLLNLTAYSMTQDSDVRAIPYSWRRDPRVAQDILGKDVDLSGPIAIAAAKDSLVTAHKAMARLLKSDVDFLDQPMSAAVGHEATEEFMRAVETSGLAIEDTTTYLSAYQAIRYAVDGVNVSRDDVIRGQKQEPLQSKFILELVAQAPPDAWPKLTPEQTKAAVGRLRQQYEPGSDYRK